MRLGIVAPSSKVSEHELGMGLEWLRAKGFEPVVHPRVLDGHRFFAGTDEARAGSFFEYARDPGLPALWSARGGYGAMRLLPLLGRLTQRHGVPPRKLLVGFSDSTALLEYARTRWGWATLHGPMPAFRRFGSMPAAEWRALERLVREGGRRGDAPWGRKRLSFLGARPARDVVAPVTGGNLAVWTSLVGTPYAGSARGKIVFLEDVDESLYRVDRMVQQLLLSDALRGARAVVLGNFLNCRDTVPQVLARAPTARDRKRLTDSPRPTDLMPLRRSMEPDEALEGIFAEVERGYGIPVARGLPVGHGPGKAPLPLGARVRLTPRGELTLESWDWKGR